MEAQGKPAFTPEFGRVNVGACIKLVVLYLLANPHVAKKYPYPKKQRRGDYATYYSAYLANQGWTGQELAELVNELFPTQWQANHWLMYKVVLGGPAGLTQFEWVKVRQEREGDRFNYTKAWYSLNDSPDGDPSRPAYRTIIQDFENLKPHLTDLMTFVTTIYRIMGEVPKEVNARG